MFSNFDTNKKIFYYYYQLLPHDDDDDDDDTTTETSPTNDDITQKTYFSHGIAKKKIVSFFSPSLPLSYSFDSSLFTNRVTCFYFIEFEQLLINDYLWSEYYGNIYK